MKSLQNLMLSLSFLMFSLSTHGTICSTQLWKASSMASLGSDSDVLKKALFEDGKILERLIRGWVDIEKLKYRVGNMGHLIRISNAIVLASSEETPSAKSANSSPVKSHSKADPYVKDQITKAGQSWSAFVTGSLAADVERQTIVPGGKPSQRPGQPPPPPQQEEQHQQESFEFDSFEFTTDADFDDIIEIGVNEGEETPGSFYLGEEHAEENSDEEDDDEFYNFNDSYSNNEAGAGAGGKKKKKHGDKAGHGHAASSAAAGDDHHDSSKKSDASTDSSAAAASDKSS
jgi:hypothetical protein